MTERETRHGKFVIRLRDERCYALGSADNVRRYEREYRLAKDDIASFYGVECEVICGETRSCLVAASGAYAGIGDHSHLLLEDSLVLAIGNSLCRLALPDLTLLWHLKVDTVACFDVYWSSRHSCLITHGELEITRISAEGEIVWQRSGKDTFSRGLELHNDCVSAEDDSGNRYHIELATGRMATDAE